MKGRIISVFKNLYRVSMENKEINAPITGNMIKSANFPVVGDYVEISDEGQIIEIYPIQESSREGNKRTAHSE